MKKAICLLLSVILLFLCTQTLSSCGRRVSAYETLLSFSHAYPMPAGLYYDSRAGEEQETYLSPDLFSLLFARADGGDDREDILEMALFLGSSPSCVAEMGIFYCPDRDAAYEVAGLVRGRLAMLEGTPLCDLSYLEGATVTLFGSTVVYTVLSDNEKALRTLSRLL